MDHKQAERQVISNMVITTLYGLNIYCEFVNIKNGSVVYTTDHL